MPLVWASISVACSFLIGLLAGAYIGFRFTVWVFRKWEAKIKAEASANSPVATVWAYDQVHQLIVRGASLEDVHAFLHEEYARLDKVMEDQGGEIVDDHFRESAPS